MTKLIRICLLTQILFLVPGCGFKDLDKRFFVTQMGVDFSGDKEKPYKIILKLAIPKSEIQPGSEKFQIMQEKGQTISQAVRLVKSKVDKELDFGHCKVIIFGEKLARNNIKTPLDWFIRRRDIQKIAYLAIGSPDAETILKIKPASERLPGNALFLSFGQSGTESAYIVTEFLFDFYRRLYARGLDPIMPVIKPLNSSSYDIRRVALFDKSKLVKILSTDDTRLFNEIAFGITKFDAVPDTRNITMALSFDHLKIKHKIITPKHGRPYINLTTKAQGIVEESNRPLSPQEWSSYEQDTAETYNKRYRQLLKLFQYLNLDPIGFGEDYLASHFHGDKSWRQWQAMYPNIRFDIKSTVLIKASGNID
jgi:Ger(x)C family germination protein